MKKRKLLLVVPITIISLFILLFFSSEWLFPNWWGSYSLGNNLYIMDWDGGEKIIVYSTNIRGRTCYSGSNVLPANNNIGRLHVKKAISNENWVIVKAELTDTNKDCFYIISKDFKIDKLTYKNINNDSIIQSHIFGPFDYISFLSELKLRKINLKIN